MADRQSGQTTDQMRAAPLNALFVWCNEALAYPRGIAKHIGREDLTIVSPSWMADDRWRGAGFSALVIDHAFYSVPRRLRELDGVSEARDYFASRRRG